MDVSIGHLRLAGRVVGSRDQDPTPRVVDLLTRPAAREQLLAGLTSAFDGEEVVVIRTLECAASLRAEPGSAPTALAGAITASAARLLRDHPTDDDVVVRFPDEAAYVAAFVHDCLDGHAHRWYYDAFEPFRRRDGSADLAALLTAYRAVRWRVLVRLRRDGDLDALLDNLGDRAMELVDAGGDEGVAWSALVTTASAVVSEALGAPVVVGDDVATALARAEPPPDWRDSASLGRAVAAATVVLLPESAVAHGGVAERLVAAARDHDWFDPEAFAAGLATRGAATAETEGEVLTPVLSPRACQVLTDLARVVTDPHLALDPRRPTSPRNLVGLVTALVQASPRWDDDDLARAVAAHVLRTWEQGLPVAMSAPPAAPPPSPRLAAEPAPPPSVRRPDPARPAAEGGPSSSRAESASPAAPPPTPVEVARLLEQRFPRPEPDPDAWESATAGGLILLRGVLDLGLSPYLLGRVGRDGEPLLSALLRRWSGGPAGEDPVLRMVAEAAGEPTPAGNLDDACRLAVTRLLGLRLVSEPLQVVTVPHGATGLAAVVTDDSGHLLPSTGADLDLPTEREEPRLRGVVSSALAAASLGHDGPDDLLLDLLAVACVQAWARWLPGFSGASVPFLLTTFVRRPAAVAVDDALLTVVLPPRSHDIVLGLAGYLEPLDASSALGGRRVRFTTGESRDT